MRGIAHELTHPATPNAHHFWIEIAMKKGASLPVFVAQTAKPASTR